MSGRAPLGAVVFAALTAAVLGGCQGGQINVWVAGPMDRLTDTGKPANDDAIFDPGPRQLDLFAGANQTAGFQLVIDAGKDGAGQVTLDFSDLSGPAGGSIPAAAMKAYRMWPVRVNAYPAWYLLVCQEAPAPAGFYDMLTPIDAPKIGQPFSLPPSGRLAIWVDVSVPRDAAPGLHHGRLAVKSGPSTLWKANVELNVYDYVLPDARPIFAVGGFDYRQVFATFISLDGKPYIPDHLDRRYEPVRQGLSLVRQLMQLAHEHRLDLFDSALHPQLKREQDGSAQIDWTDYDAIVTPYLDGSAFQDRLGVAAWPMPFRQDWPDPAGYGGPAGTAGIPNQDEPRPGTSYQRAANEAIMACRQHASEAGQAGGQFFYWPYRGPVDQEGYQRHASLARAIRQSDTQTPILTQMPPSPAAAAGLVPPEDFGDLFSMSAPPAEWLDPSGPVARRDGGNPLQGVWVAPGRPPYGPTLGILASPADVRATPWLAMKYRCAGFFIPDVLDWDHPTAQPEPQQANLFYPGTLVGLHEVLPSVRLKILRRGMEDAACLSLLAARQRPGIADALTNAMARYAGTDAAGDNCLDPRLDGWVCDPKVWQMAERLLAEEVQSAVHPETYTGRMPLAEQLAWRVFDQAVYDVSVERVCAVIRPRDPASAKPGQATAAPLLAKVSLDLCNQFGRGVGVSVALADLPSGWRPVKASETIDFMPPGSRLTVDLAAEGPAVPPDAEGKMPIGVVVTANSVAREPIKAEAPFIRAGAPAGKIVIDGKLDDWPMRAGGSAGRFKLVGKRGRAGDGLATRQTNVFVLQDGQCLYIAFRCDEPEPPAMRMRADNIIRYQELLAVDEDLVEMILDPGGQARGPEDLYHVVVKANGVVVAQKGAQTQPPLGQAGPWPATLSAAAGVYRDYWVAEIMVPLAAFGPDGAKGVWGVNFARFATQGAEASSWAGAARYFYNPRELGTMIMQPQQDAGSVGRAGISGGNAAE